MDEEKPGNKPKTAKSSANVFQRIGSAIKKPKKELEKKESKSIFGSRKERTNSDAGTVEMSSTKIPGTNCQWSTYWREYDLQYNEGLSSKKDLETLPLRAHKQTCKKLKIEIAALSSVPVDKYFLEAINATRRDLVDYQRRFESALSVAMMNHRKFENETEEKVKEPEQRREPASIILPEKPVADAVEMQQPTVPGTKASPVSPISPIKGKQRGLPGQLTAKPTYDPNALTKNTRMAETKPAKKTQESVQQEAVKTTLEAPVSPVPPVVAQSVQSSQENKETTVVDPVRQEKMDAIFKVDPKIDMLGYVLKLNEAIVLFESALKKSPGDKALEKDLKNLKALVEARKKEIGDYSEENIKSAMHQVLQNTQLSNADKLERLNLLCGVVLSTGQKVSAGVKAEYSNAVQSLSTNLLEEFSSHAREFTLRFAKLTDDDFNDFLEKADKSEKGYQSFVVDFQNYTDGLSGFIQTHILQGGDKNAAMFAVRQWLSMAIQCYQTGDYLTSHAIFSALSSPNISRIEPLLDDTVKRELATLKELTSFSDNFKNIKFIMSGQDKLGAAYSPMFMAYISWIGASQAQGVAGVEKKQIDFELQKKFYLDIVTNLVEPVRRLPSKIANVSTPPSSSRFSGHYDDTELRSLSLNVLSPTEKTSIQDNESEEGSAIMSGIDDSIYFDLKVQAKELEKSKKTFDSGMQARKENELRNVTTRQKIEEYGDRFEDARVLLQKLIEFRDATRKEILRDPMLHAHAEIQRALEIAQAKCNRLPKLKIERQNRFDELSAMVKEKKIQLKNAQMIFLLTDKKFEEDFSKHEHYQQLKDIRKNVLGLTHEIDDLDELKKQIDFVKHSLEARMHRKMGEIEKVDLEATGFPLKFIPDAKKEVTQALNERIKEFNRLHAKYIGGEKELGKQLGEMALDLRGELTRKSKGGRVNLIKENMAFLNEFSRDLMIEFSKSAPRASTVPITQVAEAVAESKKDDKGKIDEEVSLNMVASVEDGPLERIAVDGLHPAYKLNPMIMEFNQLYNTHDVSDKEKNIFLQNNIRELANLLDKEREREADKDNADPILLAQVDANNERLNVFMVELSDGSGLDSAPAVVKAPPKLESMLSTTYWYGDENCRRLADALRQQRGEPGFDHLLRAPEPNPTGVRALVLDPVNAQRGGMGAARLAQRLDKFGRASESDFLRILDRIHRADGDLRQAADHILKDEAKKGSGEEGDEWNKVLASVSDVIKKCNYNRGELAQELNLRVMAATGSDPFDDIEAAGLLEGAGPAEIRILFQANQGQFSASANSGSHWVLGEIKITKNAKGVVSIDISKHDPLGGGKFAREEIGPEAIAAIQRRMADIGFPDVEINLRANHEENRQVDGSSCGVISFRDLVLLSEGKSVGPRVKAGAQELRAQQFTMINIPAPVVAPVAVSQPPKQETKPVVPPSVPTVHAAPASIQQPKKAESAKAEAKKPGVLSGLWTSLVSGKLFAKKISKKDIENDAKLKAIFKEVNGHNPHGETSPARKVAEQVFPQLSDAELLALNRRLILLEADVNSGRNFLRNNSLAKEGLLAVLERTPDFSNKLLALYQDRKENKITPQVFFEQAFDLIPKDYKDVFKYLFSQNALLGMSEQEKAEAVMFLVKSVLSEKLPNPMDAVQVGKDMNVSANPAYATFLKDRVYSAIVGVSPALAAAGVLGKFDAPLPLDELTRKDIESPEDLKRVFNRADAGKAYGGKSNAEIAAKSLFSHFPEIGEFVELNQKLILREAVVNSDAFLRNKSLATEGLQALIARQHPEYGANLLRVYEAYEQNKTPEALQDFWKAAFDSLPKELKFVFQDLFKKLNDPEEKLKLPKSAQSVAEYVMFPVKAALQAAKRSKLQAAVGVGVAIDEMEMLSFMGGLSSAMNAKDNKDYQRFLVEEVFPKISQPAVDAKVESQKEKPVPTVYAMKEIYTEEVKVDAPEFQDLDAVDIDDLDAAIKKAEGKTLSKDVDVTWEEYQEAVTAIFNATLESNPVTPVVKASLDAHLAACKALDLAVDSKRLEEIDAEIINDINFHQGADFTSYWPTFKNSTQGLFKNAPAVAPEQSASANVEVPVSAAPQPVVAKPESPKVEGSPISKGNRQRIDIAFESMMLPIGNEGLDAKIDDIRSLLVKEKVDKTELEDKLFELQAELNAVLAEEEKGNGKSFRYQEINQIISFVNDALEAIEAPKNKFPTLEDVKASIQPESKMVEKELSTADFLSQTTKDNVTQFAYFTPEENFEDVIPLLTKNKGLGSDEKKRFAREKDAVMDSLVTTFCAEFDVKYHEVNYWLRQVEGDKKNNPKNREELYKKTMAFAHDEGAVDLADVRELILRKYTDPNFFDAYPDSTGNKTADFLRVLDTPLKWMINDVTKELSALASELASNKKLKPAQVAQQIERAEKMLSDLRVLLQLIKESAPEFHALAVNNVKHAAVGLSIRRELIELSNNIMKGSFFEQQLFSVEPAIVMSAEPQTVEEAEAHAFKQAESVEPEVGQQAKAVVIAPTAALQAGTSTFNFYRKENWDNYWKTYINAVKGQDERNPAIRLAAHNAACDAVGMGADDRAIVHAAHQDSSVFNEGFYDHFGAEAYRRNYIINFKRGCDRQFLNGEKKKGNGPAAELELNLNSGQFVSEYTNPVFIDIMRDFCQKRSVSNRDAVGVLQSLQTLVLYANRIKNLEGNDPVEKAARIAETLGESQYIEALAKFEVLRGGFYEKLGEEGQKELSQKLEAAGFLAMGEDANKFLVIAFQMLPRYPVMLEDIRKNAPVEEQAYISAVLETFKDGVLTPLNEKIRAEQAIKVLATIRGGRGESSVMPTTLLNEGYRSVKARLALRDHLDDDQKRQLIKDIDELVDNYTTKLEGKSSAEDKKKIADNIQSLSELRKVIEGSLGKKEPEKVVHEDEETDDKSSSEVVISEPWEEVRKPVQPTVDDDEELAVHVSSDDDEGDDEEETYSGESNDESFGSINPFSEKELPQSPRSPDVPLSVVASAPIVVAPPKVAARAPAVPLKGIDAFMGAQGDREQDGRRVTPDMTLNQLLNLDTSVSVISEIKNPQARAMILRDLPQLAEGYNNRQDYFAKARGTVYLRSDNREQNVINVAESLAEHSPEIKLFQELLGNLNNIEEQQVYQILMFLAKDKDAPIKDMGYFQSAYIAIDNVVGLLQGNEALKGNVKELLELKGRFEAVERLAIEKQGSDDFLPAMEKALQEIDISPLQKVRDYIAENLGQRTIEDLYNETHYVPAMPNKNVERKEWLAHVLDEAKQQFGFEAGLTSSGPREMVVDGIKVEVRYFSKGEMNLVNFDHVKERVNFLAEVADTGLMKAAHEEDLSPEVFKERQAKIQSIKEKYAKYAEEKFKNIENVSGERFEELTQDAHRMFLEMEKELVAEVYPDVKLAKAIKLFEKESKEVIIAKGRLPVVHVMGDGMISAQIPKPPEGQKNYPSTYRDSDKAGVNPNSVVEIVARRKDGGEVEIQSEFSRAVSYSVLGIHAKDESEIRKSLSYQNAKVDLENLLQLRADELEDGGTIKIHSTSLLTPAFIEKVGSKLVKLIGRFPSESRQLRDHHRALEMLNGQEFVVNGKRVRVEISHTNFSVKPSDKLKGKENKTLRALINNRGWGKYAENQYQSLMRLYAGNAEMQKWLRTNCCPEPTGKIKNLEKDLQLKYQALAGILDKANPEDINVKQSKACQREIKKLERELSKEYEALYKPIREKWKKTIGLPSRLKIDELRDAHNKATGPKKAQLARAIEKEEKKYAVLYQRHLEGIPGPPVMREFPRDKQLFYFLEAQNLYYSGAYQHRPSYLFAAAMARSNELGGIACLANCKSANDRTKWLMDCIKLLLKYENEHNDHPMMLDLQANIRPEDRKEFFFGKMLRYINDHLQEIHRQGADMRGLEYNRPGAPGSVVNDPFYGDPEGRDKPISKWGKVKPTKRDVFMAWLKPKAERSVIAQKVLDAMLAMRMDDPNVANAQKLQDVENRVLALAMVNILASKNIRIPGDITDAVIRINNLTKDAIMPDQFPEKYQDFLNIVKDIPGINDMRGEFIVAVVMQNKQLDLKDFKGQMKEDSLAVLSPQGRVNLIGEINRELDIARKHILHLNEAKQYFEKNNTDGMQTEIKALSAELDRMNKFVVSLDNKVEKLMRNLKALPQDALDTLHEEMMREFNTVTAEIDHYDAKKPDLGDDPEKLAERSRMEGFQLDTRRNLSAIESEKHDREQRNAKQVTDAVAKRVQFAEPKVETTALALRDRNPESPRKGQHYAERFNPNNNKFVHIEDPKEIQRLKDWNEAHFIEVTENEVNYKVPGEGGDLSKEQLEELVDTMLKIALQHVDNPAEYAKELEFSGTLKQMAQERLPAAIEKRMVDVRENGPVQKAKGLDSDDDSLSLKD